MESRIRAELWPTGPLKRKESVNAAARARVEARWPGDTTTGSGDTMNRFTRFASLAGTRPAGPTPAARLSGHGSRLVLVFIALALTWAMGVRPGRVKAFATGTFSGEGRTLVSLRPAYDDELVDADVATTFTTFGSRHREGLLIETSFELPDSGRELTLVLDLDRSGSRRTWQVGATHMTADLTFDGAGAQRDLVAVGVSGELTLEAAFVREGVLGFRIAGTFTVADADGRQVVVDLTIETTPSAEEVAGDWEPVDPCAAGDCWADQGAEPGCTDSQAEVYVEPSVGCSDWIDDIDDYDYDDWGDDDYDDSSDDDDSWYDDSYDDDSWDDDGYDDNGNDSDDTDENGN